MGVRSLRVLGGAEHPDREGGLGARAHQGRRGVGRHGRGPGGATELPRRAARRPAHRGPPRRSRRRRRGQGAHGALGRAQHAERPPALPRRGHRLPRAGRETTGAAVHRRREGAPARARRAGGDRHPQRAHVPPAAGADEVPRLAARLEQGDHLHRGPRGRAADGRAQGGRGLQRTGGVDLRVRPETRCDQAGRRLFGRTDQGRRRLRPWGASSCSTSGPPTVASSRRESPSRRP